MRRLFEIAWIFCSYRRKKRNNSRRHMIQNVLLYKPADVFFSKGEIFRAKIAINSVSNYNCK